MVLGALSSRMETDSALTETGFGGAQCFPCHAVLKSQIDGYILVRKRLTFLLKSIEILIAQQLEAAPPG